MAFPEILSKAEETFGSRKKLKKTPDIRVYIENSLGLIVECKATSLVFEDKFEIVSMDTLPKKSEQIIKGVLQVWRYVRDSKENITPDKDVSEDCKGLVLTLEDWISIDNGRHNLLLNKAHKLADTEGIPTSSRISVIITSVKDFIYLLEHVSFVEFLNCIDAATNPKFDGYILKNIFGDMYPGKSPVRNLISEEILNDKIWYW